MLRLDKIKNSDHVVSVKISAELIPGNIVKLGNLVDGEREIFEGTTPGAITEDVVLLTTPFFSYDEREDKRNFKLKANSINRGHILEKGDIITVSEDVVEGSATKNQFVIQQASNSKLKANASQVETTTLEFKVIDIEESVPEFFGAKGIVLMVV